MTDARLKGEWFAMLRYEQLNDGAWRVFTNALMWSAQNGTDGHIPFPIPFKLHPFGGKPAMFDELTAAGLWTPDDEGGFQLIGWDAELGQSTAAEVEAYKANGRERQRRYRERERVKLEKATMKGTTRDVTRDVTAHVGEGEGEGEGVHEKKSPAIDANVNLNTGEILGEPEPAYRWETIDGRRQKVQVSA